MVDVRHNPVITPAYSRSIDPTLPPLFGLDIETGGHVFQLHITNSRGMFERSFLAETAGRWLDGDLYFGFNINRVFQVGDRR